MGEIVKTKNRDGSLLVYLKGSIDEYTDFEDSIGPVSGAIHINLRGVNRINSSGVRSWLEYFRKLKSQTARIVFQECAIPIVLQTSLFQGFLDEGEVESVFAPMICEKCHKTSEKLIATADTQRQEFSVPTSSCPHCHETSAVFDDDPDSYFGFLKK